MKRALITIAALVTMSGVAAAQNAAPAQQNTPAPQARPATPGAPQAAPAARNSAATAQAARAAFEAGIRARQATCTAKGAIYAWVPPHSAGDVNPKGGFYTTTYGGGCRKVSLSAAISSGAVVLRGN